MKTKGYLKRNGERARMLWESGEEYFDEVLQESKQIKKANAAANIVIKKTAIFVNNPAENVSVIFRICK